MSVTFEVAHTHEQGVDFVVVSVARHVLTSPSEQEALVELMHNEYGPIPVVFAASTPGGEIEYRGRSDIVRFLASIYPEQLPWSRVTFRQAA
jgi:hypothetical protein